MKIADLELLQTVGAPTVSPDGSRAVVAVGHPSFDADANVSQLWEVPLSEGEPRRLTRGIADAGPQFSPDGALIAFLREEGDASQLTIVDSRGGEPLAITDQRLGVGDFAWAPDSASIVYAARVAEEGRYGTVEGLTPAAEPARRITTLTFRANGLGYTNDRRSQLFVVNVPAIDGEPVYDRAPTVGEVDKPVRVPESRQLTHADADHRAPRVTPDGAHLVFVAALHEGRDLDLRNDVWSLPLDAAPGQEPVRLTGTEPLSVDDVAVGSDGRIWLNALALGPDATDFVAKNGAMYLIEGGAVTRLTYPAEHDLGDASVSI